MKNTTLDNGGEFLLYHLRNFTAGPSMGCAFGHTETAGVVRYKRPKGPPPLFP